MTLDQRSKMLESQRATAVANVRLAETALAAAEDALRSIDAELDEINELAWLETQRDLRRRA